MEKQFEFCPLTNTRIDQNKISNIGQEIIYEHKITGKVKTTLPTFLALKNLRKNFPVDILTGICRNSFEEGIDPPLINSEFLNHGYKNFDYPKSFNEKCSYFLRFLYKNGGSDYKKFEIRSNLDYSICFCKDFEEFNRVLDKLQEEYFIESNRTNTLSRGIILYFGLRLTKYGIEEVEKELPKAPMVGLVDQYISIGDFETDEKINHAKKLFFEEPQNLDNMRSACETLSFVLEPLRKKLTPYFVSSKDTEEFFRIVNDFDVRHNKDYTKRIEHTEQLEWVFYSLLNTISIYSKLKTKIV